MEPIIEINNLDMIYRSKTRKGIFKSEINEVHALKNINLEIEQGSIFGLLGPNGAGKTTLIKCLTTLLIPTNGSITVNSFDIFEDDKKVRASIGAMLMGERGLYWKLTARENLNYFGQLYSVPKEKREKRIDYLISLLELDEFADRPVEGYSSGQKMKTAFAKSMIHDPPILFLDEPTIAMDVQGARKLRKIVKELPERGKTVIYTTHLMHEARELCDDLAIIDTGEIIARNSPEQLINSSKVRRSVNIRGEFSDDVVDKIENLDGTSKIAKTITEDDNIELTITVENTKQIVPDLTSLIIKSGGRIDSLDQHQPSLEDVFVELTGRSLLEDTEVDN